MPSASSSRPSTCCSWARRPAHGCPRCCSRSAPSARGDCWEGRARPPRQARALSAANVAPPRQAPMRGRGSRSHARTGRGPTKEGGPTGRRCTHRPAPRGAVRSRMHVYSHRHTNGVHCPLWPRGRPPTIAIMTTTSATPPSAAPSAVEGDASRAAGPSAEAGALDCLARRLAEVAHAIRVEAGHAGELPCLAGVFVDIENARGDLAAAAERSASAVIDADRPPGAPASHVPPTPRRARSPGACTGSPTRYAHRARSVRPSRALRASTPARNRPIAAARRRAGASSAGSWARLRERRAAADREA
jgi:hypothetical protein